MASSNTFNFPSNSTFVLPIRPAYQATVEHVDDYEMDGYSTTPSSSPTIPSSSSSVSDLQINDEDIEEITREMRLCRLSAAELSTSLWGMVKPKNFGRVMPGVYRSAFPQPENITFLKALGLKSILTLVPDACSPQHERVLAEHGIQHFRISIQANKDPLVLQSHTNTVAALSLIMDRANHPLLIHCNQGKHRTGCIVGCLRKTMGWSLADVFAEYHNFAGPKARLLDELFMERFDERALLWQARTNDFLPRDEPASDSPITTLTSARLCG